MAWPQLCKLFTNLQTQIVRKSVNNLGLQGLGRTNSWKYKVLQARADVSMIWLKRVKIQPNGPPLNRPDRSMSVGRQRASPTCAKVCYGQILQKPQMGNTCNTHLITIESQGKWNPSMKRIPEDTCVNEDILYKSPNTLTNRCMHNLHFSNTLEL